MLWKTRTLLCLTIICTTALLSGCVITGGSTTARPDRGEWLDISSNISETRPVLATSAQETSGQPLHRYYKNSGLVAIQQQNILTPSQANFDRIALVRLKIDGHEVDVSNLSPRLISKAGKFSKVSITAVRVADDLSDIVFFSRSPVTGHGYMTEIPLTLVEAGFSFDFPILQGGKLQGKPIEIMEVTHRPALAQPLARFRYSGVLNN